MMRCLVAFCLLMQVSYGSNFLENKLEGSSALIPFENWDSLKAVNPIVEGKKEETWGKLTNTEVVKTEIIISDVVVKDDVIEFVKREEKTSVGETVKVEVKIWKEVYGIGENGKMQLLAMIDGKEENGQILYEGVYKPNLFTKIVVASETKSAVTTSGNVKSESKSVVCDKKIDKKAKVRELIMVYSQLLIFVMVGVILIILMLRKR